MTQRVQARRGELIVVEALMGLAILGALVAATAGLILMIGAPASGSSTEATLGFTAAASGIATAVFAAAATIYAQIRNLWRYAPSWVRIAAWAALAFAVLSSFWRSIG